MPLDSHDKDSLLASWTASIGGLDWLDQLVRDGKATDYGGDGYPMRYTAPARHVLPLIASSPPGHGGPAVVGDDYFLPSGWVGKTRMSREKLTQCPPDEELYIEAWDES